MPWDANGNWIQGDGIQAQGGYVPGSGVGAYVPSGGGEPGSNLGSGGAPNWWDQNYPAPGVSPQQANKAAASSPTGQHSGNAAADWQAFIQSKGYTGTYARANMGQLVQEFNAAYGYNAKAGNANASGSTDTVDFGDGQGLRDLIHGGDDAWQNIPDSPGGGSGSGGGAGGVGMTDQERAAYGVPNNQYASNPYSGGYTAPQWTGSFTAPTNITEQNDPGYQARLDADQQARQRSAAAQGTILNGGTQQALGEAAQNYASNEYSNVFNRAFEQYQQKYGEFNTQNQQNLGAEQNQYQEYLGNNQRTLSDYLTNYNIGRTGVQDFLNQNNATANRGLTAVTAGRPA